MANSAHLQLLQQGVDLWNGGRPYDVDLAGANLSGVDLRGADLVRANLNGADLSRALLIAADLSWAKLRKAELIEADLREADLRGADLRGAKLRAANLAEAMLRQADFRGADLTGSDLRGATLIETKLQNATLTGCRVYGISAWNVKLSKGSKKQQGLVITAPDEPEVSVDNIEVAQVVYLLLNNAKIRDVIDTIGQKGVLLLGRFTKDRIVVLERLREELRKRGYLPIVFNFDKPKTKTITETVRLLAGLSHFVIVDITKPKSSPLELKATVPECMVPFRPIIQKGEKPFSMFKDLWILHPDWVFKPISYSSLDALIAALDKRIIEPAEVRFSKLLRRKAKEMTVEHV
jgi:hypothetical protein